jgi:hypothetical protein
MAKDGIANKGLELKKEREASGLCLGHRGAILHRMFRFNNLERRGY